MGHICQEEPQRKFTCRFVWFLWGDKWCGKVIKCPQCAKAINYRLSCQPINCPHYESKKWYKWRGWHPHIYKSDYFEGD